MKKIAFEPHLESINISYSKYFKNNKEIDFKILKKPRWKDKSHFKILRMIVFMIKTFKDFSVGKYDLVHINGINFAIIAYLSSFFRCKYIITLHSIGNKKINDGNKILEKISSILRPIVLKRAQKVFTVSYFAKKEIEKNYNIKVNVIYNGVFKDYIEKKNNNNNRDIIKRKNFKVFISVGRMVESKNPFRIIDIFEISKKTFKNSKLIFIGDGELFYKVKAYATFKKLSKDIMFLKNIPFEDMKKWYIKADYFISACDIEAFGLAALEATSCGCMPILPKKGAFLEIFTKDRYLYDVNKINSIKFFEPTEEDRKYLSKIVKKYSWEKAIEQYALEYKNMK